MKKAGEGRGRKNVKLEMESEMRVGDYTANGLKLFSLLDDVTINM